ncbi:MAG: Ig-like domain-containing protein [Candidatus Pacearchaeota archaeon]
MVTKSKFLLAAAVILVIAFSLVSVSAATQNFYPKWGIDTTSGVYIMNSSDLAKVNSSEDDRYSTKGYWSSSYCDEYLQWNFSSSLSGLTITGSSLTFEWQRTSSTEAEARLRVWDHTAGSWSSWYNLSAPNANQDYNFTVNLSSFINTVSDINNFKVQFQAKDGSGAKTKHDLVQLTVNYEEPDTQEPDTNVTHFTRDDGSDRRNCTWNGTAYQAFVNFADDDIVGNGVSADDQSNLSNIWYIRTGWAYWDPAGYGNLKQVVPWWTHADDFWGGRSVYKVCGRAKDVYHNEEPALPVEEVPEDDCCWLCIDRQNPGTVSNLKPDVDDCSEQGHYSNSSCVTWTWNHAIDNGCAGIDYYIVKLYFSNGTFVSEIETEDTSEEFCNLEDGEDYYVTVEAVDKATNVGNPVQSDEVIIDLTDPEVTITGPDPEQWYDPGFWVSETDFDVNLDKCYYKITDTYDGSHTEWIQTTCNQDVYVDPAIYCQHDGEYCKIEKKATDFACREGFDDETYKVDTHKPTVNKTVGEPKYPGRQWMQWLLDWFITDKTPITITCDDGQGSGVQAIYYRINSGEWLTSPNPFTLSPDGVYFIEYYCVDNVNKTSDMKNETDKVDTEGPETTKTISEPKYLNGAYISSQTLFTLTAEDEEVGCKEIHYEYGSPGSGQGSGPCNGTSFHIVGPDGNYTLEFWAFDLLDNEETHKTQHHFLDNTPPQITIENPDSPVGCAMLQFDVIAKVIDPIVNGGASGVKNVEVRIDGGNWQEMIYLGNNRWYARFSNLIDAGYHNIEVRAFDNVNNSNTKIKNVKFEEDVYWEVQPNNCEVLKSEGKECSFRYKMTLCHGGNSVAMAMHKLCCLTWLNPKLYTSSDLVDVTELWKLNTFWYEGSLQEMFGWTHFPGWCDNTVVREWNEIALENFNTTTRTGYVTLNFTVPQGISGSCEKMYYAVKPSYKIHEPYDSTQQLVLDHIIPRVSYFRITWPTGKVIFEPVGPNYGECGNGIIEAGEQCDLNNLGGKTCSDYGYNSGTLSCNSECKIVTSACYNTGGQGGGHGGGGQVAGGQTTCKENWICTPWGPCVAGFEYRTCKDINNCGTTLEKPDEKQTCTGEAAGPSENNINSATSNGITGAAIGGRGNPLVGALIMAVIVAGALAIMLVTKKRGKKKF